MPFIVFLDLDKTVIGRAHCAVDRLFVREVVRQLVDAGEVGVDGAPTPLDPAAEMAPLLRPGFGDAVRRIRAALGRVAPVELFVCTAGQALAVASLKVPGIERAARVRFRRPLFHASSEPPSRSAASDKLKLVGACFRAAAASLRRRYPALARPNVVAAAHARRFVMVDDTPAVAFDAASNARLVTCPPYERMPWASPVEGLPAVALRSPKLREYLRVNADAFAEHRRAADADADADLLRRGDDYWPRLAAAVEAAVARDPADPLRWLLARG